MQGTKLIRTCSIWRALEVIGDTPTLLIIEANLLGVRRFDDFGRMTGLLKALLSDRLKRLLASGIFEKRQYSANPPRFDYRLTEKGQALYPVAMMLLRWEAKWPSDQKKIPVEPIHKLCGHKFEPVLTCDHCHDEVVAFDVDWREGPGVGWMAPVYSRRRQQRASVEVSTSLLELSAQLMGDRWASLIMRSIFTGIHRFDEIRRDTAIATNILSERLAWLIANDILRQHQYATGPDRFEYRVTRRGIDYYPALLALMQWGDKYYCSPEGPPLILTHKSCGHNLDPIVVCSECRLPLHPHDVTAERPAFLTSDPASAVAAV